MRPAWLSRRVSGEPRRYHLTRACAIRRYEPEQVPVMLARKVARLCSTCARRNLLTGTIPELPVARRNLQ